MAHTIPYRPRPKSEGPTPDQVLDTILDSARRFFRLEIKAVEGTTFVDLTLVVAPPDLPLELYKKYKNRYIAVRIETRHMRNPEYVHEIGKKMGYEVMNALLRKHPKKLYGKRH